MVDLKSRLRTKQVSSVGRRERRHGRSYSRLSLFKAFNPPYSIDKNDVELPPFPGENTTSNKAPKEEMQDFLDDLLS
jgi:hypothetical protein